MPITHLGELKAFLTSRNLSPRKAFSQNFLIDQNIVHKILAEASIQSGDHVLEIGPGPGALTEELLNRGATVYAVEYDHGMAKALERFNAEPGQFFIFCEDFLNFNLEQLPQGIKVVANLPYHLSSMILEKLFFSIDRFSSFVFMLQEEYVQRIQARSSTKDFGRLTVFVNYFCSIKNVFSVSPQCFYPAPKVRSSVIHLTPRKERALETPAPFLAFVKQMFLHRRKTLRKNLGKEKALLLEGSEFSPLWRPENLDTEQWLKLFHLVSPSLIKQNKAKEDSCD